MNGPFVVAQAGSNSSSSTSSSHSSATPIQIIKIVKPPAGQTEVFHASFTGTVKIDFTAIANLQITLYHDSADQTLHIIFADGSQAIIYPFFDSTGSVLSNLSLEMAPGQELTGAEFAGQFPITSDQSLLPAAGPEGLFTPAGAYFLNASVDPLLTGPPLPLLPPETLLPFQLHEIFGGTFGNNVVFENVVSGIGGGLNDLPTVSGTVSGIVEEEQLNPQYIQVFSDVWYGNEDTNDAAGNDTDGLPPDNITQYFNGTLAGLVTGGDSPITFLTNSAADATPVHDSNGNAVTSIGETVQYLFIDSTTIEGVVPSGEGDPRVVFILHVNTDGTFTFELTDQIDHPVPRHSDGTNPPGIFEETLNLDLSSAIAAHDATPDPVVFPANTFDVGVIDDTPVLVNVQQDGEFNLDLVTSDGSGTVSSVDGNTTEAWHTLDDENQPDGIRHGPGDDGWGTCVSGEFGVRFGADGPSHFEVTEGEDGLSVIGTNPLIVDPSKVMVTNDNGVQVPLDQFKAIYIESDGTGTQHVINIAWTPDSSYFGGGTLTGTADDGHGGTFDVFTLQVTHAYTTVDGTDVYCYDFTALAPLAHPFNADGSVTTDPSAFEDNLHIDFTYTATDFDQDSVDGHLIFNVDDDVPKVCLQTNESGTVIHDETTGTQSDHDATDVAYAALSLVFQNAFDGVANKGSDPDVTQDNGAIGFAQSNGPLVLADVHFGADGAAVSNAETFALTLSGDGVDSGLKTTDGHEIDLFLENNIIVGRVLDGADAGNAAFAIAIDPSTGDAAVAQYLSLQHGSPDNGDISEPLYLNSGIISVSVAATDGDGDTTTQSLDVSAQFKFLDDGPTAVDEITQTLTESHIDNIDFLSAPVSVSEGDGFVSITTINGATAGDILTVDYTGPNGANKVSYQLVDTATSTVVQSGDNGNPAADPLLITIPADGSYELLIQDNQNNNTMTVDDVQLQHASITTFSGDVTTNDIFGTDGFGRVTEISYTDGSGTHTETMPDTLGTDSVTVPTLYGSLTIDEFGVYTYTVNLDAVPAGDPDGQVLDHFTYTISDGDGDTSSANMDFVINDTQAPNILNGALITNTASGAQEMILTFVDQDHPLDAYSQLFVREAEGQQGAVASDTGFIINSSDHFQVALENPIDGHKVIVTDFTLEGVTIDAPSGNIQLDHEGTSNKEDGITAVIQPSVDVLVTGTYSLDGDENANR